MRIIRASVVLLIAATAASAAVTPISESFTSDALPAGFNLASDSSARQVSYTDVGVVFDPSKAGDNGRNYVRTDRTDYWTDSFTAYLTVTADQGDSYGNTANFFFGMGTWAPGQYGVPDRDTQNDVIMVEFNIPLNPIPDAWQFLGYKNNTEDEDSQTVYPTSSPGPHRLMLQYDASALTLSAAVDFNYDGGAFQPDQTLPTLDVSKYADATGWAAGENSAIFFGGDGAAVARDFVLIPEPATLGLLAMGLVTLVRRRR